MSSATTGAATAPGGCSSISISSVRRARSERARSTDAPAEAVGRSEVELQGGDAGGPGGLLLVPPEVSERLAATSRHEGPLGGVVGGLLNTSLRHGWWGRRHFSGCGRKIERRGAVNCYDFAVDWPVSCAAFMLIADRRAADQIRWRTLAFSLVSVKEENSVLSQATAGCSAKFN